MIPVVWFDAHPLCWDQALLDELFAGDLWPTGHEFEHHVDKPPNGTDGAVVVVPARYHTVEDVKAVTDPMRWAVVILTSDEEGLFPWRALQRDGVEVWVQTPNVDRHEEPTRPLVLGWPPATRRLLQGYPGDKPFAWFFSGQVNHERRRVCFRELRRLSDGTAVRTSGFTQGMDRPVYLHSTAEAKIVPCPSGPHTPDTFRVWEALEAGTVPIVDARSPAQDSYWEQFGPVPFPIIDDWTDLPAVMATTLARWPQLAAACSAWWLQHKRTLAKQISDDIFRLSGEARCSRDVTVLIPTSPIPTNPSTGIIEATVATIRHALPNAELIVMCDGLRAEQDHYRPTYDEYLRRVTQLCAHTWAPAVPVIFPDHQHQANMTRTALDMVDTPLVLFVEHDTPFSDEPIDWAAAVAALLTGDLDVLRFHHEAQILVDHKQLMIDHQPIDVAGCPVMRTMQWSQRPHLARSDYYRQILDEWFPPDCRTMIEDKMHSVAQTEPGHRLAIYAPEGTMRRTLHLDGRGADPKYEMDFGTCR